VWYTDSDWLPPVSLLDLRRWVIDGYDIPGNSFSVKRYFPEDFIVVFSYHDDMLRVLHDPPVGNSTLSFVLKRWRRQLHGSAEDLRLQEALHGYVAAFRGFPGSRGRLFGRFC
jgi:hypothetical protein